MKRIGAMAAVALIALLIALPLGLVAAQGDAPRANVPPAFIFGNAMADGLPVPEGTMIVAMAGDEEDWFRHGHAGRRFRTAAHAAHGNGRHGHVHDR